MELKFRNRKDSVIIHTNPPYKAIECRPAPRAVVGGKNIPFYKKTFNDKRCEIM